MDNSDRFQRIIFTLLVAVCFFYGGYYFGQRGFVFELRKSPPSVQILNKYPDDQVVDFKTFWDVWGLLSENYLERPVDTQKMLQGAIKGMVNALDDPYTSYLPPELNKAMGDALNGGSYQGIGAELGIRDGHLIVVSPQDGSPAKESGVKPGDKILEIDGVSTAGISLTEAVTKIRGNAGTFVKLKLQSNDTPAREINIKRGVIDVASVTWKDKGDGTGYIRVSIFGGETVDEWSKVVSQMNIQMEELDAIILDLRGNPGGYLDSSVYLAEEFFNKKPVLYEETATGDVNPLEADREGAFTTVPSIFVLIDGGSASASEILAAALRSNANATLIGTKSFGKGTIQTSKDFSDGSGLHITIAKWLTPEKEWVHKNGIEPDIVVERTDEEVEKGIDVQLDKAIELAKEI